MKKLFFIVTVLIAMAACESDKTVITVTQETNEFAVSLDNVITQGNFTYIPIRKNCYLEECAKYALAALNLFEKKHPELEILSYNVDKTPAISDGQYVIFEAIWVYHKPKKETEEGSQ